MEYEFKKAGIPFGREVRYDVLYKETVLPLYFFADFVVYDRVILEIKAKDGINDIFTAQTLNYLKVSGCRLGQIANFGRPSLEFKRLVF